MSSIKNNSTNNLPKIQHQLRENNSLKVVFNDNHRIYNSDKKQYLLNSERHFLNMTKIFCTIIFTIEMMIYVIAHEFIFGSDTYLHNRWNIRNGFVVIISIVDLTTMYCSTVIPLNTESEEATFINRASGLELVLQALISSLRPIDHNYERQEKTTYLTKCTLELERRRCRKHELSYYVPWRRR
ncbi:unnamed protein product [Rotaria sp. Silwood1]|nr:unnamed protein product [Rotaria sp. Silwood1]